MRRAKHPRAYALLGMKWNGKTGLYEISEAGITYGMSLEVTRSIKDYFRVNEKNTVADWYKQLPKGEKATVTRVGYQEAQDSDFYADPEYTD